MRVPKVLIAVFLLVNLLLVAACLFALQQNVKLRNEVVYDVQLLTPAKGTVVPPLVGEDWQGTPQAVAYGQDPRPTLVYTFTKECPHCQQNWRAMRSLQALAPNRLRIIYVDTIHDLFTTAYFVQKGIEQSTLLVQLSPETAVAYDARAVPQILLVDHDGRVQWSHVGELAGGDVSEVLMLIKGD